MSNQLVKKINLGGSSSPRDMISNGGILYFAAESSDGSKTNTDTAESDTQVVNDSATQSMGLWKSDGSNGGTVLLQSFDSVSNLVVANERVYFIAGIDNSFEIWSTDGTSSGTQKVNSLNPGKDNFSAYKLYALDDTLFFSASGPEGDPNGYELWRWKGNGVGTKIFKNLFPNEIITEQSIDIDDEGRKTLTVSTEPINFGDPEYSSDSFPDNFTSADNGNFFFTAYSTTILDSILDEYPYFFQEDRRLGGIELWFSDGTEAGTRPIAINNQPYSIYNPTSGSFSPPEIVEEDSNYIATSSSFPSELTSFQDKVYFSANDGIHGYELWSVTNQGVKEKLVMDIHPSGSSNPSEITVTDNHLYFTADNGKGRSLYILKANQNKPIKVKNSGKNPINLTAANGSLYYSAESKSGQEPWAASGTKAKTMANIYPGNRSSNPSNFLPINQSSGGETASYLFFAANNGNNGFELWSKNLKRKKEKPKLAADIYPGTPSSYPNELSKANETLFFTANKGGSGRELWKLDISDNYVDSNSTDTNNENSSNNLDNNNIISNEQPSLVKDIRPEKKGSAPDQIYNHQDKLYFAANNGVTGKELWTSQGTKNSTALFKDINKGAAGSFPSSFTNDKKSLFFSANDGKKGKELWMSNGAKNNTKRVTDIYPGPRSSSPSYPLIINNRIYFAADNGTLGRELWSYKLNSGNASLVRNIRSGTNIGSNPTELTNVNDQIIFAAEGNVYGRELWISNGKKSGTRLLNDINPGGFSSNPRDLNLWGKSLYFTADTYYYGPQILKLNSNNFQTQAIIGSTGDFAPSNPEALHAAQDELFYSALTLPADSQQETTPDPPQGGGSGSSCDPGGFMKASSGIEAKAIEYINNYNTSINRHNEFDNSDFLGSAKYWAEQLLDSTLVNTNDSSLAEDWNQYFQVCSEDSPIQIPTGSSSTAATRQSTSSPGGGGIDIENDDSQNENNLGRELWISSGKQNGSALLKDINPGAESSNPANFTTVGSKTYFSADGGTDGEELWVTDGTAEGTYQAADINRGPKSSSPTSITEADNSIYFSAKSEQYGRELWRLATTVSNKSNKSLARRNPDLKRIVYSSPDAAKMRGKDNTSDEFIFSDKNQFGTKNADRIIHFSSSDGDLIQLDDQAFQGINPNRFKSTSTLQEFTDQLKQNSSIIYFEPTGELYFDQNGSNEGFGNAGDSGLFAILEGAPKITRSDIAMI